MTDPADKFDRELRDLARAALADAEGRVDVERELAEMLRRAADPSGSEPAATRSPWLLVGAAASVVGLLVGGIVLSRDRGDDIVRTATGDAPIVATTTPPLTSEPSPTVAPSTDLPASTAVAPAATVAPSTTGALPPDPGGPDDADGFAVGVRCVAEYICTQLATMNDGRVVAYDPVGDTLTVLDSLGETIQDVTELAEPIGPLRPWLVTVGPDDVAYFSVDQPNVRDPIQDLLAIPIFGEGAGVAFKISTVDGSGDSDLVPTAAGLAIVGCCGFDPVRPLVDDSTIPWLDRRGQVTTSDGPTFRLELGEPRDTLIRVDDGVERARFETPVLAASPRGMPHLAATDDGGAVMLLYSEIEGASFIVRFRPGVGIEDTDVFLVPESLWNGVELFEPSGTVIVRDGDRFVRRTLTEIGHRVPETGVEYRTVPGAPIESCRDTAALALDDVSDVQLGWSVRGGPVGDDGLYIAVDDAFGRRLMTGCGTSPLADEPLAGDGWLVWPMDGATAVLLAEPQAGGLVTTPNWLGQAIAQLNVDGTLTTVEIFLVADDAELPTDISGERRADERVLVGLIEQARNEQTVTSSFGPALTP